MFETEKQELEVARNQLENIKNAVLDKTEIQVSLSILKMLGLGELIVCTVPFYLASFHGIAMIIGISAIVDSVVIAEIIRKNAMYNKKYESFQKLSLEGLREKEETIHERVRTLQSQLRLKMNTSSQEREEISIPTQEIYQANRTEEALNDSNPKQLTKRIGKHRG